MRIGINGFGRIGRLAFRVLQDHPGVRVAHVNDPHADAATCAHLVTFDSVHGRMRPEAEAHDGAVVASGRTTTVSGAGTPGEIPWPEGGVDVVLECSGRFRTPKDIGAHLAAGAGHVAVAAPVRGEGVPNVVMGVNHGLIEPGATRLATAASCTTNCLAPVVKVLHEGLGIRHGSLTTLHDLTNTQRVVDAPHKDLRRARAASLSLIPTTTGSASAIGTIFPELAGRLDGIAVRVPMLNASLTDCVFEVARPTDVAEVNALLEEAARGELEGILGYEERPLVSVDHRGDPRSGIVDAPCTRVTGGTQVKVMAWYDNEWGYANRLVELALLMGGAPAGRSPT